MCSIAGIIGGSINEITLRKALETMTHRGPDSNGIFSEKNITLLHTRLSIQDLSESANQPFFSADQRYCIIFNGEIYNHLEIRNKLALNGQKFQSQSDTETLLYGYIYFGKAILDMLNGIFSFAIYDKVKKQFFAARDCFGVKPFYYYSGQDIFSFASEIKTLLQLSNIEKTINPNALLQTLLLQWQLGEDTGFLKVKKLLPGHYVELNVDDAKNFRTEKWAKEKLTGTYDAGTEEEWISKLDAALNNAVRRQLLSDKPIAYFLSGGLDSSLLLAITHKIAPEKTLKAFTIDAGKDFSKEGFSEDLPYAKMVAKHLDIELEIIDASIDFLKDFDAMIYHLDEAQADIAPMFVQQISKVAKREGYDVLIGGVGGDDIFSGYRRHHALAYEKKIKAIPLFLRKALHQFSTFLPENNKTRRLLKLSKSLEQSSLQRMFSYYFWNDKETIQALFTKEYRDKIDTNNIEDFFSTLLSELPEETNALNQILHLEQKSFLPNHNLNYTDKMGMAEGVEIRVPFLDNELVALAAKIPPELKMKGTTTKYLLKKVAEKYLSKEVIYRSKTGFGAPIRSWMQEDKIFQNAVWERLNRPSFIGRNIFDHQAIEQLFQDTIHKKRDNSYTLLSLLAIESWFRQFVD